MASTEDWAYRNIVGALPGWTPPLPLALAIQLVGFGGGAVVIARWFDQWAALPAALVAVGVATAGSGLMTVVSDRIRAADPPAPYHDLLFGSSIDVVMGVVAFVAFLAYAITRDPPGVVGTVVGAETPVPVVFLALMVIWDLCYRIGTAWWASVVGAWRSLVYAASFDRATRRQYLGSDLLVIVFAGVQLALVPFVWGSLLGWLVVGHVGAVAVVSGGSIARLAIGP